MATKKYISSTVSVSTVEDGQDGKDAREVQPNILLRTVFDRGIDFVKEQWTSDWWSAVTVENQYTVQGRKSLRFTYTGSAHEIKQNVYGRMKPSTWYTLSFYYFADRAWWTFIEAEGSFVVDMSAGVIVDGVRQSANEDGSWQWGADMSGSRHTFTFKTKSTLPPDYFNIWFRATASAVFLCMPKLEEGESATAYMAHEDDLVGDAGERGKTGRMYYYAGEFDITDTTTQFAVTDAQTPFFQYNNNYWVYNPKTNPSGGIITMAQMGTPSSQEGSNWTIMTNDFPYLITKAIFATEFANFGSAVISGDWIISTKGKINESYSEQYNAFDPAHPSANVGTNFVPNFAIDLKSGSLRTNNIVFPPTIIEGMQYESDGALFKTHTKIYENPSGGLAHFCPKKNHILSGSNMCYKNVMYNSSTLGDGYVSITLPCSYYTGYDGGDWRTSDADLADMLGCQLRITNYAINATGVSQLNIYNVFGLSSGRVNLGSITLQSFQSLLFELRYLGTTYGYQWCLLSKGDLPTF